MLFQSSSVTIEVSSNHFPAQNTQEVPISLRVKDKKGQHHPYPHAPSLSDLISFLSPHLLLQPLASNSSRKPGRLPRGIFTLVVPSAWNILYPKIYMATHSLPSGLYSKATCSVKPSLACYLALHIPSSAFFFPLALTTTSHYICIHLPSVIAVSCTPLEHRLLKGSWLCLPRYPHDLEC